MDGLSLLLTFLAGALASFIGSTVGGAAFVSVPALIFLGVPPQVAVATARFGGLGLRSTALPTYWKKHKIQWDFMLTFCVLTVIGAVIGANLLLQIDPTLLTRIIGVALLIMLPLMFFNHIGVKKRKARHKPLGFASYLLVKIWGGFMGSGAESVTFYVYMYFFGMPMVTAVATSQLPGTILQIITVLIFAWHGIINYSFGGVLFIGMMVGGYMGSKTAIKKGDGWILKLLSFVVVAMALKLLFF